MSAPDASSDPVERREGNMPGMTAGKRPGIIKYSNVTLKNGVTSSQVFADWMKTALYGKAERKTVVIGPMDNAMTEVASWQLEKARPTKSLISTATSSEAAVESLELVTEGVTRTT